MGEGPPRVRIVFQPSGVRALAERGTDIASAARKAGLQIGGICGGIGNCGKCRVFIREGKHRRSVLSCRTNPVKNITVEVPPETVCSGERILTESIYINTVPEPGVCIVTDEDGPHLVQNPSGTRTRLGKRPKGCFGVAFDMGTTTLVASLYDLSTGRRLAVASALNPQVAMGEDVVSRITLSVSDRTGASGLRAVLLKALNRLIRECCTKSGVMPGEVFDICAVGNTFMHHNFLGVSVSGLSQAPYAIAFPGEKNTGAGALGLKAAPQARAYVPPVIAHFLGSDALAGALAAGLDRAAGPTLYIDLGTNGELLLAFENHILGATTAAGPAFEGAQVSCGMRASDGAITHVKLAKKGHFRVEHIGRGKPIGIAGSGLVDAVSELVSAGAIDRRGTLVLGHGLVRAGPGERRAVIARGKREISVSQGDIRNLQLAKSAIAAGAQVLMSEAGLVAEELECVLLAGAFGNYIDILSAKNIGLVPDVVTRKVLSVGNAALAGAGMMLLSLGERRRAVALAREIRYIELARNPDFRELFVDNLGF